MSNEEAWEGWPNNFQKIDTIDQVSTDTFLDIIKKYQERGVREIWVRHKHYPSKYGKIKNFKINSKGELSTLEVWREEGGYGLWEAKLCKLINRPKEKKGPKKQKIVQKAFCNKHPNYTGQRRPRTNCDQCLRFYESNNSGKQKTVPNSRK